MPVKKKIPFSDVWERVKSNTPIKTLVELADFTGTSQPTVSRKKKENDWPVEWAYNLAQEYGLFTEWIMAGKGPKNLDECHGPKEELLTGYIAEWIKEQSGKNPNFSTNFQTDCALVFPEFAKWLKERKARKQ